MFLGQLTIAGSENSNHKVSMVSGTLSPTDRGPGIRYYHGRQIKSWNMPYLILNFQVGKSALISPIESVLAYPRLLFTELLKSMG